jgi:hypothetical protein
MPVVTQCPNPECAKAYRVADSAVGRTALCRKCDTRFRVRQGKGEIISLGSSSGRTLTQSKAESTGASDTVERGPTNGTHNHREDHVPAEWNAGNVILESVYNLGLVERRAGRIDDVALVRQLREAGTNCEPWRVALRLVGELGQDTDALGPGLGTGTQATCRLGRGCPAIPGNIPHAADPLHRPPARGSTTHGDRDCIGSERHSLPTWSDADFQHLLHILGCSGLGWLRPEGVRKKLNEMAATWQGPPSMPGQECSYRNDHNAECVN